MRVTMTGATGLIGTKLVRELVARGDEVTVLSRNPDKARAALDGVEAVGWADPTPPPPRPTRSTAATPSSTSPASRSPSAGTTRSRSASAASREAGTRNLVAGMRAAGPPARWSSSSAVGYYGPHGDERLDEDTPPGDDFLAEVCVAWEREAQAPAGARRARPHRHRARRGRRRAGEDAAVLQARRRRPGGGRQAVHAVDPPRRPASASTSRRSTARTGRARSTASAPEPVTNKAFSKTLGKVLKRPAFAPVPAFAIKAALRRDGRRSSSRASARCPSARSALGYSFRHTDLEAALQYALGKDARSDTSPDI